MREEFLQASAWLELENADNSAIPTRFKNKLLIRENKNKKGGVLYVRTQKPGSKNSR